MIEVLEMLELRIRGAILNMEGDGHCIENIPSCCFVVISKIDEHCFFIANVEVVLQTVVDLDRRALVDSRMWNFHL